MLSMQTKIETPKHLLALPFPFYVSGVFGSICGGELMGRLYEPGSDSLPKNEHIDWKNLTIRLS